MVPLHSVVQASGALSNQLAFALYLAGFLATLQLEGMRDGLEDLELYYLLSRRVEEAKELGLDTSREASAMEASTTITRHHPPRA